MNNQNQNLLPQQCNTTQQMRLVPMTSNISYVGTTVTYGLQGGNTNYTSGNYGMNQQYGGNNNGYTNFNPSISAGQFDQFGSGTFDYTTTNNINNFTNPNRRNILVQPSIDISETSSEIVVSAYVTNNPINNMNLNVTQDSCTISGNVWTGNESLILHRTIPLTTSVRAEACEATLQSGVLEIRLPKMEKTSKSKTIVGQDITKG